MRFFFLGSAKERSCTDGTAISSVLRLMDIGTMRLAFLAGRPSNTVADPCSQGGKTVMGDGAGGALHDTGAGNGAAAVSVATSSTGRL